MFDQPPRALHERHRFSIVWLVPVIAGIAAIWLGYHALSQRGPGIEITLRSAAGIEAGRTVVRHNQIELGQVVAMEPSADLSRVTLQVRMNHYAENHLNAGTRFWVVRPRFSVGGVSGLGTLISGAYIEMEPGPGASTRSFTALEDPPVVSSDVPGTEYVLHGQKLGSISQGAPVTFNGIDVGEVLGYTLSDEDGSATAHIFVRAPHNQLVHEGTRFWNASGISVALGSDGLRLQSESLQSILAGGVAFGVPNGGMPGRVAEPLSVFTLYAAADEARDALFTRKVSFLLRLGGSAQGLSAGAPVRMQGLRVGEVTDVHLEFDEATKTISVPVTIEVEPQRVRILNGDASEAGFERRAYDAFRTFVARGLRAKLASGSLITGQKLIALDFDASASPAQMIEGAGPPELPVVDSGDLDSILQSTKDLLTGLKATVASLNQIVGSGETKRSMQSLDQSLANLDHLTHEASMQGGPLLTALRAVARSADQTLAEAKTMLATTRVAVGNDGGGGNLAEALSELRQTARSVRVLADYLEGHPGSLVWGKNGGASR